MSSSPSAFRPVDREERDDVRGEDEIAEHAQADGLVRSWEAFSSVGYRGPSGDLRARLAATGSGTCLACSVGGGVALGVLGSPAHVGRAHPTRIQIAISGPVVIGEDLNRERSACDGDGQVDEDDHHHATLQRCFVMTETSSSTVGRQDPTRQHDHVHPPPGNGEGSTPSGSGRRGLVGLVGSACSGW